MSRIIEKLCAEAAAEAAKEEARAEAIAEATTKAVKNIKNIMAKFKIGITEAMSTLDIPKEEYGRYTELVENYK